MSEIAKTSGPKSSAVFSGLDQAVSSATNFGSTIAAAVLLSAASFGQFSIAFIIYVIIIGAFQAFVGQELVLRTGSNKSLREASGNAIRFSVISSIFVSTATAIVFIVFFPYFLMTLLPFLVALPFLVGQEIMRFACASQGRMRLALILDSIWILSLILLLLIITLGLPPDSIEAWHIGSIWAVSGVASFAVGSIFLPWFGKQTQSTTRYLARGYIGRRFLIEFLAMRGTSQSLGLALGGFAGTVSAGAYRGASTLSGPLGVLLGTVSSFGAPLLRRVETHRRTNWLLRLSCLLALVAILWTIFLALIPDYLGQLVLGETWTGAKDLIVPIALQTVALGFSIPFFMALRVHWPRVTLWVQLAGSFLTVTLFFLGLATWGVSGAAWGQFAAAGFQAIIVCWTYLLLSRKSID